MLPINTRLVDRIAELLHIDSHFYDYRGEQHTISNVARLRLIQAFGYHIIDDASAQDCILALESQAWLNPLPPVAVLHEHWHNALEIVVNQTQLDKSACWRIQTESGELIQQEFLPQLQEYLGEAVIENKRLLRYRLSLPQQLPLGYHHFTLQLYDPEQLAECPLYVVPQQCYQPDCLAANARLWGFSIQLYTLRSSTNWGIGDYRDLAELVKLAAEQGADFIGVNPLHALFPFNPLHCSPYSPSSRLFINYLYLDITAIPDYAEHRFAKALVTAKAFQAELAELRRSTAVDYAAVAAKKLKILRLLYNRFCELQYEPQTERGMAFRRFIAQGGAALLHQATYDALHKYLQSKQITGGWQSWPEEYKSPQSDAVKRFQLNYPDEILFFQYLQWLSAEQLHGVQELALAAGMRIGLYQDLAVGPERGGAEVWSAQSQYALLASIGAPPDPLALQGQDWGLPPLHPGELQRTGYRHFIELVRANMGRCGALRIDHVMSLLRLWWIPLGEPGDNGAYVYYPLPDLLGILALESQRQQCLIIGEDLGTVPEAIRTALPAANVYSYRVKYFERQAEQSFKHPAEYPRLAMATVSTHDLPTLKGWWEACDIDVQERLQLLPAQTDYDLARQLRNEDCQRLLKLLIQTGYLPVTIDPYSPDLPKMDFTLISAVYQQLASSKAALLVVQLEDLLEMTAPVNVPGTTVEYPNWQRKLTADLADIFANTQIRQSLQRLTTIRQAKDQSY